MVSKVVPLTMDRTQSLFINAAVPNSATGPSFWPPARCGFARKPNRSSRHVFSRPDVLPLLRVRQTHLGCRACGRGRAVYLSANAAQSESAGTPKVSLSPWPLDQTLKVKGAEDGESSDGGTPAVHSVASAIVDGSPSPLEWCYSCDDSEDGTTRTSPQYVDVLDYDGRPMKDDLRARCPPLKLKHPYAVNTQFVNTFRMSLPYLNLFRGSTFVIHVPFDFVRSGVAFARMMKDVALMASVGVRIVLVLGADQEAARVLMEEQGRSLVFQGHVQHAGDAHDINHARNSLGEGHYATPRDALPLVKQLAGKILFDTNAALVAGFSSAPLKKRINVISGNFYSAQPLGVLNGHDFGSSGFVRRLDEPSLRKRLENNDVVVLTNVGFSPSGEVFNCDSRRVARTVAVELRASKLVFFTGSEMLFDSARNIIVENMPAKAMAMVLESRSGAYVPSHLRGYLEEATRAVQKGVQRAHLLDKKEDGSLVLEVFHRDGVGLMITGDVYEGIRPARRSDLPGIIGVLEPLEAKGVLVKRPREQLEAELDRWVVVERDGMINGVAALKSFPDDPHTLELGPLAIHENYRSGGKGNALLSYMERTALSKGARRIFILSTVSFEWFLERGFHEGTVDQLPRSKAEGYNTGRRSKIYFKPLTNVKSIDSEDMLRL
ncbi:Amino-acid acetyltransferase [Porphyridium purpureum]|uniref:amino-acid N-acetyltransferase n=1 Tax=Porphyridium purpureum TaxID=35688 RepID=A0A5J4Z5V4_PORPP|nr:Amino-acid acetyltransferase [Porphyridium purpureum]|eukprot:POR4365..scf295_1